MLEYTECPERTSLPQEHENTNSRREPVQRQVSVNAAAPPQQGDNSGSMHTDRHPFSSFPFSCFSPLVSRPPSPTLLKRKKFEVDCSWGKSQKKLCARKDDAWCAGLGRVGENAEDMQIGLECHWMGARMCCGTTDDFVYCRA